MDYKYNNNRKKEAMMKAKRFELVGTLFLLSLLLASLALADTDLLYTCTENTACSNFCTTAGYGANCYCNNTTFHCYLRNYTAAPPATDCAPNCPSTWINDGECDAACNNAPCRYDGNDCNPNAAAVTPATPSTTTTTTTSSSTSTDLASLRYQITSLETQVASLQSSISSLESQLSTIPQQFQSFDSNLNENSQKLNSLSTGLAGLQENFDQTQSNITAIEQNLQQERTFSTILKVILFTLLLAAFGLGLAYYLTMKKNGPKPISPEVAEYITAQIKQGKKYPQIKDHLLRTGWSVEDIHQAYKETMRRNYALYQQKNYQFKSQSNYSSGLFESSAVSSSRINPAKDNSLANERPMDKKKVMIMAGVGLAILIGALLILSGTVGNAIFFKKLVGGQEGGYAGEVTYDVECTSPHILTPEGDACCLDNNNNQICDITEQRTVEAMIANVCIDNNQCSNSQYCVNSQCQALSTLYLGNGDCTKMCHYYSVRIITSDGETYTVKPNQGSYTSAGALEWKMLTMPDYCKGEAAIVPIKLVKKNRGQIVSEEVLTLTEGQQTRPIAHPEISDSRFTLTVDKIYELCPE